MNRRHALIITIISLIFPFYVSAQSPEFVWSSPRSMGLGGVTTTGFEEPSAMHLNPASLVDIERFSINTGLGAGFFNSNISSTEDSLDSESNVHLYPSISGAFNFGSRLAAAGFSLNTFDYFHLEYPKGSFNRYQATEALRYSGGIDLALAFMPIRNWSVGVKVGYLAAHSEWERHINPIPQNPDSDLDMIWRLEMDTTSDWSALAGIIWSPNYRFEAGLTYRPSMAYHFEPDVIVELPEILGGETIRSSAKDLRLEIPQEIKLGFHWLASERVDIYFDAGWTNYSSIEDIEITTDDPKTNIIDAKYQFPQKLDDVWHGHLGVEYLTSSFLTLRCGAFYYSDNSNEDYDTTFYPTGQHYGYTLGAGFHLFEWDVDIAAGQTIYPEKDISGTKTPFPLSAETEFNDVFGSISFKYRF